MVFFALLGLLGCLPVENIKPVESSRAIQSDTAAEAAAIDSTQSVLGEESQAVRDKSVAYICSYAPSQQGMVKSLIAAANGDPALPELPTEAIGVTPATTIIHNSIAYVQTGSKENLVDAVGAAAAVPLSITLGAVTGVGQGVLELSCFTTNHPETAAKISENVDGLAQQGQKFIDKSRQEMLDNFAQMKLKVLKIQNSLNQPTAVNPLQPAALPAD
ncbi:MAG: hypothetical protein HQL49_11325 [Gammaproteobacteria bacterium]|nr:hypothetical protein [Gammaproteobacteria bacterium]